MAGFWPLATGLASLTLTCYEPGRGGVDISVGRTKPIANRAPRRRGASSRQATNRPISTDSPHSAVDSTFASAFYGCKNGNGTHGGPSEAGGQFLKWPEGEA